MEDKHFSLWCQIRMQRNHFFRGFFIVKHLSHTCLGYSFLLGQFKINNKAVGRELNEISASLLREPAFWTPLCY